MVRRQPRPDDSERTEFLLPKLQTVRDRERIAQSRWAQGQIAVYMIRARAVSRVPTCCKDRRSGSALTTCEQPTQEMADRRCRSTPEAARDPLARHAFHDRRRSPYFAKTSTGSSGPCL